MRVARLAAQAREVLHRRPHPTVVQSLHRRGDQWRNHRGVGAERAAADDRVARVGPHVGDGRQVQAHARGAQARAVDSLQLAHVFGAARGHHARPRRREARLDVRHLPTFLVEHDQDRVIEARARCKGLQSIAQPFQAGRVAAEIRRKQKHAADLVVDQERADSVKRHGSSP